MTFLLHIYSLESSLIAIYGNIIRSHYSDLAGIIPKSRDFRGWCDSQCCSMQYLHGPYFNCQCFSSVNLTGILRMEDVPGALLGVFPCRRLFPETIWGSAQLIRSSRWSDSLSSVNLTFFTRRPCTFPHYVSLSNKWNLSYTVAGFTLSSCHQSRRNSTTQLTSIFLPAVSSPDTPTSSALFFWNAV